MAGRLVEQVNRLIRSGVASITEESTDIAARTGAAQQEWALHLVRDKLGKLIVERRQLARQLTDLPAVASELTEKAELAVRKGREDLARAAMAEVASMTSGRTGLADEIAGLDADIALLEDAIAQLTKSKQTPQDASLRALLAELDRLATQPDDQRREGQER
jgi:phage shock protein A